MIKRLSNWWQAKTGVDDSPFDGDSTAFVSSLLVHLGILIALGLIPLWGDEDDAKAAAHGRKLVRCDTSWPVGQRIG